MKLRASVLRFALSLTVFASASYHAKAHAQQRQPTPQPVRRECSMAGLWSSGPGPSAWATDFSADGRWHTYYTLEQARRASPALSGTFVAEGNAIRFMVLNQPTAEGYLYRVTVTGNACESLRLELQPASSSQYPNGFTINFTRVVQDQQQQPQQQQ